MNCFTGTSMMISEQWTAVCCRRERECVEQNWILFSSDGLTAFCMQQCLGTFTQSQRASIAFIMSVCLFVCLTASISAIPIGRIDAKFMKISRKKSKID